MKKYLRLRFLFAFLIITIVGGAQQTAEKYIQEMRYLLYLPDGYNADTAKHWPTILFLHGSGESGTDIEIVKKNGPPKLVSENKSYPFIIISPQATNGWSVDQLFGLIKDIKKKYRVDDERLYLTGLSMGGFGTWNLAMEHPELFAAIAPVCGGGSPDKLYRLRNMPVWCFHGAKDNVVPIINSRRLVDSLRQYNKDVRFTIYPEADHDSWTATYNNDSLYTWLLSKKRFQYTPISLAAGKLAPYAGRYLTPDNDTIAIRQVNDTLFLSIGRRNNIHLYPASEKIFYFESGTPEEIRFLKMKDDSVGGFLYLGRDRQVFIRVRSKQTKANNQ